MINSLSGQKIQALVVDCSKPIHSKKGAETRADAEPVMANTIKIAINSHLYSTSQRGFNFLKSHIVIL